MNGQSCIRRVDYELTQWDNRLKKFVTKTLTYTWIDPKIYTTNKLFDMKKDSFIRIMIKQDYGKFKLNDRQFEIAKQELNELRSVDMFNIYTLEEENRVITKVRRVHKILTGELSELEDRFVKTRTIKNRQYIVSVFDSVKLDMITTVQATVILKPLIN